ncbi:hypothetical protein BMEI0809 [Brucella melitensis bv. 1 str. 16M]|uniref:Heparan-alpha-glucosaminide N-acetyltransferase catalytic domain-containing protein n=1 Tax=Brucella melitensis biotype 1 (strain ATCC 23456 / CCUG 17765 / NCTC 10094 / 16M) TaxID=224914 RepID=Q8YHI9_BRUME|nr:hypothetical protein BMEI0809 [Brucella melitensis bv. 1 str. 16M]
METTPSPRPRLGRIDIAHGIALIAMAIYHFGWDLEFFGYMAPATTAQGGWKLFARCIASSFLFLVGFSLVLAHGRGIRWRPMAKRLLQIIAAAAAISAVTWYMTPDSFIFFGILHQIALASVLGFFSSIFRPASRQRWPCWLWPRRIIWPRIFSTRPFSPGSAFQLCHRAPTIMCRCFRGSERFWPV